MNELINLEQLSDRLNIGKPTIVSNTLNRDYMKSKKKGNE